MPKKETKKQRSAIMARVKGKNTKPEIKVRRLVFSMGYRYRLHARELPGKPDIIFRPRKKIIFIHGCFWHGHDCRAGKNKPASNLSYWDQKLERNKTRDVENLRLLKNSGWRTLVIWECEIKDVNALKSRIKKFLEK